MKKLLFAVLLITASAAMVTADIQPSFAKSGGGNSDNIPASQVPKPVKKNFRTMYPGVGQVEWDFTPAAYYGYAYYTAGFKIGSQKWEANYREDGTFISAYPKM